MKKLVTLMLAAMLLFGMAVSFMACGETTTAEENGATTPEPETTPEPNEMPDDIDYDFQGDAWPAGPYLGFEDNANWFVGAANPNAEVNAWLLRNGKTQAQIDALESLIIFLPHLPLLGNVSAETLAEMIDEETADDWNFTFEIYRRGGRKVGTFESTLASFVLHPAGHVILRFTPEHWDTPWIPEVNQVYDVIVTVTGPDSEYVFNTPESGFRLGAGA